ncbi:hypothetical protein TrVE_jg14199 [Triparma verrucosa]|uniref:Uncharacterized protein n=1 Tax=Triparma verrucosa TaxID=1606542 RepID=A0A9W7EPA9_9STRA|nr:hypothetical protein TrVE_jg14199 [Triparma verrucosa]
MSFPSSPPPTSHKSPSAQANPLATPPTSSPKQDLGAFSPSMSIKMFKQGSEGRVRVATQQESFGLDGVHPKVAAPIVWTAIILQALIVVVFWFAINTDGAKNTDGATDGQAQDEQMRHDDFGAALDSGTLKAYISIALLPYLRILSYFNLLSSTSKSFGPREMVSMSILLLGQIFRAVSHDEHLGRVDLINPHSFKILQFFADLTLCFCCRYLKTRISGLNFNEKEIFVYKTLPTVLVGVFVPSVYLSSETAACWVPNNHGNWDDTTETCHNIFVSNSALSYAILGSGFLYLVMSPFLTKHYSLQNLVSFNFPFFRTYVQIITFIVSMFLALFVFATAGEILDADFYFNTKFDLFVLWFIDATMERRIQWTSYFIQFAFFLLAISFIVPLPTEQTDGRELESIVSGIELEATRRTRIRYRHRISRYLKSKLMTRRLNELAPFYRYLAIFVLGVLVQTLCWEVGFRRSLFTEAWRIFNYYTTPCSNEDSVCSCDDFGKCYRTKYEFAEEDGAWEGNKKYVDFLNITLGNAFIQCTSKEGNVYFTAPTMFNLDCDYDRRLDLDELNPRSFYYWATRKFLVTDCCMNMMSLYFLGLLVLSRPAAGVHLFTDITAALFLLISHACLFYNCNIVMNEDKQFSPEVSFFEKAGPTFEFMGVTFSFFCFVTLFIFGRLCRNYLKAHTENEINVHFQRSLCLFMSAVPPSVFLYFEARYCGNFAGVSSPSCSMLAQANFAVVVNIVMGVTFFALFNFSSPNLKLVDFLRVSDKIQNFDVIFRFILMGILQFVAMIIFGYRPRDADDEPPQITRTDHEMQHYALDIFTPVLPSIWTLLCLVYYFKLGHDEHVEKAIGEEDEDVVLPVTFIIWDTINRKTKWIVDLIRVPEDSVRLSPFLEAIFLLLGVIASTPFLLARLFQGEEDVRDENQALFTLWTVVLRNSGDLLIPVSLLYLSVHFMSDLSQPNVRIRTTIPLAVISLLYIIDTATFFEQPNEYKQKVAKTEDKGGTTWFKKQMIVCISVLMLLLLIVFRKKSILKLPAEDRRKHLFANVAYISLSALSTLTYLIAEYFSCATRLINKQIDKMEFKDQTTGKIVETYIDGNQCEAISYNLTPLVLVLVFTAIGKVIYPEASEEDPVKIVMTLDLAPFRIFQLIVGTLMAMTAIVMFGVRHESRIDPWVETFCLVYFSLTLFMFISEGFYTTSFAKMRNRDRGNDDFDVEFPENEGPSLRLKRSSLEMRKNVGSEKSIWNGGTKGRHKGLAKNRTKCEITTSSRMDQGDEMMMGAGVLGENSLAPGML